LDYSILKEKIENFSQVQQVQVERVDNLMSSIGELSGMVNSQEEVLGNISNSFDYLENIEFSREKFFGSLSALKSMADNAYYKVENNEDLVKNLTTYLESFFKDYKFLDMFDSLKDLFSDLESLKEKVNFLVKSFYKNDFEKLYQKFISFFDEIFKFSSRVDNIYSEFRKVFDEGVNLNKKFNDLVSNSGFIENKKKLIDSMQSIISDYDLLLFKLRNEVEPPNYLFVGQSLNNYISKMKNFGYRDDYIEDYLYYNGVSREMSRAVIGMVNFNENRKQN